MKIKKEVTIDFTSEEILQLIDNDNQELSMYDVAEKALSQISWHDNMPKSSKLRYISMLQKHIDAFLENINRNNDLSALANER